MHTTIGWFVFGLAQALAAESAEWPQFRGPDGQGHADAQGLPVTWSETENIAWKVALPGMGWSSSAMRGQQIWLTTATEEGKSLRVLCVDRQTGSLLRDVEIFQVEEPPHLNAKNSHASPSPIVDENHVYVHFGTSGTACLDADSGAIVWTNRDLKCDHKEGPGSSPIIWGDLLIVNCDGIDSQYVAALDKDNGQLAWKTPRTGELPPNNDFHKAYSTPLIIPVAGRDQLVSPGASRVVAYDPATGAELWKVNYEGYSNVPRPVFGHGLVYVCTGYNHPQLWAIRPQGQGDITETAVAWKAPKQVPANPSPLLVGDELYMVSDQSVATCLDAVTGRELWHQRLRGGFSASPIYADGHIYFWSEDGQTAVIAPGKKFELLATNQLDGRIMATPAIVGRAIFLRTDTSLYRIEVPSVQ